MRTIEAVDAHRQFVSLLDEVANGESITITKHGVPVARLIPPEEKQRDVREVIAELLEFQKEHTLGDVTIRELIDEGRRTL